MVESIIDPGKTTILLGAAGCGKTHALLNEVELALATGSMPNKIGYVSFTKKAAEEGKTRASEKFGIPPDDLPHFRTIHSFAFRHLGMKRDQVLNWQHLKELGKMLGLEFKGRREIVADETYGMNAADRMIFLDGLAKNTKQPLKKVWEDANEDSIDWFELQRFSNTLTAFKKNKSLFDFTDMIQRFNSTDPISLPQFDLLAVDEFQDLSALQYDTVELLARNAKKIVVSGDDCQSVHKWAGADVDRFIGLPGKQTNLVQSYRVPLSVHRLADSITDRITNKRQRSWIPRKEIGAVNWFNSIDEVDLSKGTWMLLARNGYMLTELENYCLQQGFSFHSVSRDPLKSHALTVIRTWENLRRGLDESSERILDCLRYAHPSLVPASLTKVLKADEPEKMRGMPELRALGLGSDKIWHMTLTKISPAERDFFIAARRRGEKLLGKPRVTISTIHSVKGGEAENVLLLTDVSYRTFNNMQTAFEDECRVWYVACTRCKETLNIILPRTNLSFSI